MTISLQDSMSIEKNLTCKTLSITEKRAFSIIFKQDNAIYLLLLAQGPLLAISVLYGYK